MFADFDNTARRFAIVCRHMCDKLFPTGYDVRPDAPDTYEDLCAMLAKPHARMAVYGEENDKDAYAEGSVDAHRDFRAWHDWTHWNIKRDFSKESEYEVFKAQIGHMRAIWGFMPDIEHFMYLELIGQLDFSYRHDGNMPADQNAFVRAASAHYHGAVRA